MKKIIKFIIIPLLSFTLFSSIAVSANSKTENNKVLEDIEKMIRENDFDSVKKVETDENGKIKLVEEINKKDLEGLFQNGTYIFDRRDGWVRGRDLGVLKSIIIPEGATGELQKVEYSEFISTITKTTSFGFDLGFVKSAVTTAYGEGVGEGIEITVKQSKTAEDTDIFFKAQTLYKKYEIVEYKDSKIINHATSYQPTSFTTENLKFKAGTKVNQKKLYEREDRCIYGKPDYDSKPVIVPKIDYSENIGEVNPYQTWPKSTQAFYKQQTAGLSFTVTHDGDYVFKDLIRHNNTVNSRFKATGMSMAIYKLDDNNNVVEKIADKPADVKVYNQIAPPNFVGNPLNAKLTKNTKYLLTINEEKKSYWDSTGTIIAEIDFSLK